MGFLECWSFINMILKLTDNVNYTWMQVFKPMWLGYPIMIVGAIVIAVLYSWMNGDK